MAPYNVKLFKIESTHENLRSEVIEGQCFELPKLKESFILTGQGVEFGTRLVWTTPVLGITTLGNTILFQTKNSTYALLKQSEKS